MTIYATNVLQQAYREMGMLEDINATGGSATTVVDSNSRFTADNSLVGGTVIVTRDAGGAGASPEGRWGRISAFAASTKTFTMDTVSDAVASGDGIGLCQPSIPITQGLQALNNGLTNLGYIDTLDATLVYDNSVSQYTLPVSLKTGDIRDILLQTISGTSFLGWISVKGQARIETNSPGSTGLLYLPLGLSYTGAEIKVIYNGYHAALTAYNSTVAEAIPLSLAVAATIQQALTWLASKRGDSSLGTFLLQRKNEAEQVLAAREIKTPKWRTPSKPRFFVAGREGVYVGDQSIYNKAQ